jgi:siroheme synthase
MVEIVPGITAAQGAASVLGVPLTDRHRAGRLQLLTGHGKGGTLPCDLDWASLADRATTTAIYMPVRTLADLVAKAIKRGLDPETPAVAISRATRPDQSMLAGRIGNLPARLAQAAPVGPVLVMIGEVFSGKIVTKVGETTIRAKERRIACAGSAEGRSDAGLPICQAAAVIRPGKTQSMCGPQRNVGGDRSERPPDSSVVRLRRRLDHSLY